MPMPSSAPTPPQRLEVLEQFLNRPGAHASERTAECEKQLHAVQYRPCRVPATSPRGRASRPRTTDQTRSRCRPTVRPRGAEQAESSQQVMTIAPSIDSALTLVLQRDEPCLREVVARRHGRRRNPAWRPPQSEL
jgi:hypothetical protein